MLYIYRCPKCDRTFECNQSIKALPHTTCNVCRGPIHRVPQKPNIAFKGTGYHVTDYPNK